MLKNEEELGYSPFQYDDVDSSDVRRQTSNNDL